MKDNLSQVETYFPEIASPKNKEELVSLIIKEMEEKGSVDYSGLKDKQTLYEGILQYIGNNDTSTYQAISETESKNIQKHIQQTIKKCDEILPVPTKNFVFVFPYLPTEKDSVFSGVMGVARYSCVFHIFLSPKLWTPNVLENTVVHELNHTIYYYHHYEKLNNYTLLDQMILEGLAENFREKVTGDKPAPWAISLERDESLKLFNTLNKEKLDTTNQNTINEILFGNNEYKRWTGYSIGYWIIKDLLDKRPKLSWEEIMKLSSSEIIEIIK